MNELHISANELVKIRKALLLTASAVTFAICSSVGQTAKAASDDRPTIWIEGGWHFESVTGEGNLLIPPLDASVRSAGLPSLTTIENAFGRTSGAEGSISFQPNGSDWVFTASARYGRSRTARDVLEKKNIPGPLMKTFAGFDSGGRFINNPVVPTHDAYVAESATNSEAHVVVDFQVGKDVGIGLFGRGTDSIISFGVRYAQMNGRSKAHSYANPDAIFEQFSGVLPQGTKYRIFTNYHHSATYVERNGSLHALGPSLSLKNTTGLWGSVAEGQLALDWGVNAALLFGRQRVKAVHHSSMTYVQVLGGNTTNTYPTVARTQSRMVTIPNVGGFAGLSYRFINAKLSAGYRADFFFGAKDSGLETRSTTDVGFHGPFATISIGLGGQ